MILRTLEERQLHEEVARIAKEEVEGSVDWNIGEIQDRTLARAMEVVTPLDNHVKRLISMIVFAEALLRSFPPGDEISRNRWADYLDAMKENYRRAPWSPRRQGRQEVSRTGTKVPAKSRPTLIEYTPPKPGSTVERLKYLTERYKGGTLGLLAHYFSIVTGIEIPKDKPEATAQEHASTEQKAEKPAGAAKTGKTHPDKGPEEKNASAKKGH